MFTVRSAIVASVVVLVTSLVLGIVSLSRPPDSDGLSTDTYGTRWHGLRATYELLAELGVPLDRRVAPPPADLPLPTTLVLWLPNDELVSAEPAYLERLLPWVEQGGRIVVAPAPSDQPTVKILAAKKSTDVLTLLGLGGVQLAGRSALEIAGLAATDGIDEQDESEQASGRRTRIRRGAEQAWKDVQNPRSIPFDTVAVKGTGNLKETLAGVERIVLPHESTSDLAFNDSLESAAGLLRYTAADKTERILAASFQRGRGEIVVVAESSLAMNVKLAESDNAVFAYALLTDGGKRGVVFDEFYHGLSVRGNPLWLLTQSRYAVFSLVGSALIGLVILRRGMLLGPPLETLPKSRRTLGEYVEAMSRFLHRGRASTPFLLAEVRGGVLRLLAERYNLGAGEPTPEAVAGAIGRRAPAEAERFRAALGSLDAAQARGKSCSQSEALRAIQGISRCL
ncbi:MAG: DUF4350 domain-containing protein [Planctomycetia bacterium]|nr:DUF4350 domain-containing protein [Planctomycetia bacterium]